MRNGQAPHDSEEPLQLALRAREGSVIGPPAGICTWGLGDKAAIARAAELAVGEGVQGRSALVFPPFDFLPTVLLG